MCLKYMKQNMLLTPKAKLMALGIILCLLLNDVLTQFSVNFQGKNPATKRLTALDLF